MRIAGQVRNILLMIVSLCAMTASSTAQDSKEGNSILCVHMTMISFLGAAKECFAERDREYISAMEETIARFDDFVLRNSPGATSENLKAFHQHHSEVGRRGALEVPDCKPMQYSMVGYYEDYKEAMPPEKLREMADTLLAVDRVPTFSPCY